MATIITETTYTSGYGYGNNHKLIMTMKKHNNDVKYFKTEKSHNEPYEYETIRVNKQFYENVLQCGKYGEGETIIRRE